jgi:hypothetical protein
MRLPRNLSGSELAQALHKLGYSITRQTTHEQGKHHLTIPQHTHFVLELCQPSLLMLQRILNAVAMKFLNASSVRTLNLFHGASRGAP